MAHAILICADGMRPVCISIHKIIAFGCACRDLQCPMVLLCWPWDAYNGNFSMGCFNRNGLWVIDDMNIFNLKLLKNVYGMRFSLGISWLPVMMTTGICTF